MNLHRFHRTAALALVIGLNLSLLPVQAQTAGAGKKELVAKLLQLQQTGIEGIGRGMAAQTANSVMQAAGQALSQVAPDKREAAAKDIQTEVKKFHDEIEPMLRERATKLAQPTLGPMLEEKFSEDELKQIIAWLDSPTSKKYGQFSQEMETALAQKLITDTRASVEPKLKTLQAALQKKLGLPAAAPAGPAASAAKPAAKK